MFGHQIRCGSLSSLFDWKEVYDPNRPQIAYLAQQVKGEECKAMSLESQFTGLCI